LAETPNATADATSRSELITPLAGAVVAECGVDNCCHTANQEETAGVAAIIAVARSVDIAGGASGLIPVAGYRT